MKELKTIKTKQKTTKWQKVSYGLAFIYFLFLVSVLVVCIYQHFLEISIH
jgi:hypothetical protein